MSEARNRKTATSSSKPQANGAEDPTPLQKKAASSGVSVSDVLRILGGIVLLNCALSYFVTNQSVTWGWRPWYSKPSEVKAWLVRNRNAYAIQNTNSRACRLTDGKKQQGGPINLSDEQLLAYDGTDPEKPIYLALNGTIYDVSASRHTYGPGGSYNFFAGRDATRAFVSGCFDTDLTPDMRGVEEIYVPVDAEEAAEEVGAEGELVRKGGKKEFSKAELKLRREREYRVARKMVSDTIEGWAKMFRGDKGGKNYFKVGEVKREDGWLEKLPKRELCERAQKQRPKRKEE